MTWVKYARTASAVVGGYVDADTTASLYPRQEIAGSNWSVGDDLWHPILTINGLTWTLGDGFTTQQDCEAAIRRMVNGTTVTALSN